MADGTIKSKLQLDGEQQYKQALNDAYRSLRVLRSELKAETAELGRNASEQDKAKTKIAGLKKQIEEQQKIVKTLEQALADSRKEYADNQEVQDKWAEKLNKAREALANMQNQMESAEDSLTGFSRSMQEVSAGSQEAMTTVVSFNDCLKSIGSIVGGVSNSLKGIFTNSVETMKSMVSEMYSLMGQAWAAAGEWKDIQTIWGGDLTQIEEVFTGAKLQGVDPGLITGGIEKLVANVHGGNKDTIAALKSMGIEEKDMQSHWELWYKTMQELSMRQGKTRDDLVRAIWGDKKGSGMALLVDNWQEMREKYAEDVQGTGLDLTSDEIEQLDQVAHKITEIQELWNTIKTNIGAKLSEVLNMDQLTEDTLDILRTIGQLLSGEGDSKELTITLSDQIETLLTDISNGMTNLSSFLKELGGNLKESDNPFVRFIGELSETLGDVLDWLGKNGLTIASILERLLPLIGINKASELVTGKGIGDWVTDIVKTGIDIAMLGKLFGGAAGAAIGGAASTFGSTAAAEIGATASSFGAGIGAAIIKAVPWLAGLVTLLTPSGTDSGEVIVGENGEKYDTAGNELTETDTENGIVLDLAKEATKAAIEESRETVKNDPAGKGTNIDLTAGGIVGGAKDVVGRAVDWVKNTAETAFNSWLWNGQNTANFWSQTAEGAGNGITSAADWARETLGKALGIDLSTAGSVNEITGNGNPVQAIENLNKMTQSQAQRAMDEMIRGIMDRLLPGNAEAAAWSESDQDSRAGRELWATDEEYVDLDDVYTAAQKMDAIQDWWDANRNAEMGVDSYEEEARAFEHMVEALGDDWGDVWDTIITNLGEIENQHELEDLPSGWFADISSALHNLNQNNEYRGDEKSNLPALIEAACERGTAKKQVRVTVTLDGSTIMDYVDRGLADSFHIRG